MIHCKNLIILLILAGVFLLHSGNLNAQAQDSAILRLTVNLQDHSLLVDNEIIEAELISGGTDSLYQFQYSVPAGPHKVDLKHADFVNISKNIILFPDDTIDLRFDFSIPAESKLVDSAVQTTYAAGLLKISSSPESSEITIDGKSPDFITPGETLLRSRDYEIKVTKTDWEPLTYVAKIEPFQTTKLNFILKSLPPEPIMADSLGFEFMPILPMRDVYEVEKTKRRYSNMTETFLVFPLAQGIIFKALANDSDQEIANVMIISGLALSTGSYIIGKILSSKKASEIEKENEQISSLNLEAQAHNRSIEQTIKQINNEAQNNWQDENAKRGKVEMEQE